MTHSDTLLSVIWVTETYLMHAITHPTIMNYKAKFVSLRMDQQSAKDVSAEGKELTLLQRGQNKPPATFPMWLN